MRHPDRTFLRKICLILGLGVITAICGCSKLIEIAPPTTTITTSQTFSSNDLTESALAGVYTQLINADITELFSNGGFTVYAGLSADELSCTKSTNDIVHYPFVINKVQVNTPFTIACWPAAYKVIYSVNNIIEGIAASTSSLLDDSTRRQVTGEAKFIRAFTYFYLTNMFGDVPLVLSSNYVVNATMARTPQVLVYQQMVTDLKAAEQLLSPGYDFARGERVRANRYAASALLARVYLYQKDWGNAASKADSLISNSQYSLLPDLRDVFLSNSKEAILQFKQTEANPSNTLGGRTLEAYLFNPYVKLSSFPPDYLPIFTDSTTFAQSGTNLVPSFYINTPLTKAFETGDKRRTQWIDSVPTPVTAPYFGVPIYYPSKYPEIFSDPGRRYYTVLRLGEQYLIAAEAKAQLGEIGGAQTALNAIRNRAGLPDTKATDKESLLEAVAHERRTELFIEWGHRWLDLKRTGMAKTVLSAIPEKQPWQDYQLLYPLPLTELVANPLLAQNPGYN